jgi:hypothetical protein
MAEGNRMTYLYLDIETIPAQRPDVLEEIRASKQAELDSALAAVKAPSNYGAEAAAKWWAEKGEAQKIALQGAFDADVDETYRKTSFDGGFGQVCVIGFALDGESPLHLRAINLTSEAEKSLLMAFTDYLNEAIAKNEWFTTTVVGHNVAAFDLRFLVQRYIVRGVRPHTIIARAAQAKPWEQEKVYDTLIQWAGNGAKTGGSLDKLCKALSIPSPKDGIDGSKVWDFVRDGRIAEVAEYCARDVSATRAVHRRMTFAA